MWFCHLIKSFFFYTFAFCCGGVEVFWFHVKQKILGDRLPNYFIVEDSALHRGGQPSSSGLKQLTKNGIKTIINLRLGKFSRQAVKEYVQDKVRIVHIPFSPFAPKDHIMIDVLKIILNPDYRPAFVHCFHGADRTGAVCAIYRIIVQNWDKERAILEMKKRGLHWWHTNMVDYIRNLDVSALRRRLIV